LLIGLPTAKPLLQSSKTISDVTSLVTEEDEVNPIKVLPGPPPRSAAYRQIDALGRGRERG
jgi:hypothetical protein